MASTHNKETQEMTDPEITVRAETAEQLRHAIETAEQTAVTLEALGGPRRLERARREREFARLWRWQLEQTFHGGGK